MEKIILGAKNGNSCSILADVIPDVQVLRLH